MILKKVLKTYSSMIKITMVSLKISSLKFWEELYKTKVLNSSNFDVTYDNFIYLLFSKDLLS